MHQDLAFEEPLKFVLLILICLRFMPIKKYQDCKAILGLIQFPQGEKKLSSVRAPGKERPLQKRANHDSAGAVPHSISCKQPLNRRLQRAWMSCASLYVQAGRPTRRFAGIRISSPICKLWSSRQCFHSGEWWDAMYGPFICYHF